MRGLVALAAIGSLSALSACSPRVPDSAAGVGLDNDPFAAAPAAGTTIYGEPLVPPSRVSSEPLPGAATSISPAPRYAGTSTTSSTGSSDIAAETAAALRASQSNSGRAPLEASPSNPAPQLVGNPGLSDENSFEAVSARQTIESDAARLQQQRSQYQQVQPTALPSQSGARSPNIVKYALSTSHPVGTKLYSRAGINLKSRSARNCAGFSSAELAQLAFLEAGGPQRDRKVLDPDGDGYACGWDPRPYRLAVRGNS